MRLQRNLAAYVLACQSAYHGSAAERMAAHRGLGNDVAYKWLMGSGLDPGPFGLPDNWQSFLWQRLILPVRHVWTGEIVGVVSRALRKGERPKYWNNPFVKRYQLFGFPRQRAYDYVVLVEGQLDAVSLDHLGIPTFSIMGGFPAPEQAALALRYSDVLLCWPDQSVEPSKRARWLRACQSCGALTGLVSYGRSRCGDPDELAHEDPGYARRMVELAYRRVTATATSSRHREMEPGYRV